MKKFALLTALILVSGPLMAKTYPIDTEESQISWVGKKVTGQHEGIIAIKEGSVDLKGDMLVGGTFIIDLESIEVSDLEGDSAMKLEGHLKSDDFFGVKKYPTAKFKITKVTGSTITGDLTIKNSTQPLTFEAQIENEDDQFSAIAEGVKVDRTLYDIRYGSGKFFEGLGDKVIYDDFILDIEIVALKTE